MFKIRTLLISLALFASLAAQAGTIEVGGKLSMTAKLHNSPVSSLAIGPGAKAESGVNVVEGNVKVKGDASFSADLHNSPVSSLAIGPMAKATAFVNALRN